MITKRGTEMPFPVDVWHRLQAAARPSLKQLLLSDAARTEFNLPVRGNARRRAAQAIQNARCTVCGVR